MLSPRWRRAVDGYYSTVQKNILVHFETQASQINHHVAMANAHPDVSVDDWFMLYQGTSPYQVSSNAELDTANFTLVSGETYEFDIVYFNDRADKIKPKIGAVDVQRFNFTGGSSNVALRRSDYNDLLSSVVSRSSSVKTKLAGFVGDLYAEYGAGDIPTEDVIDPVTAATQMGQDTGMAGQAAGCCHAWDSHLGIVQPFSLELQDADGTAPSSRWTPNSTPKPPHRRER